MKKMPHVTSDRVLYSPSNNCLVPSCQTQGEFNLSVEDSYIRLD